MAQKSSKLHAADGEKEDDARGHRKVFIIGGGVAGLTAAHELQERGFAVTVYERKAQPGSTSDVVLGGKARSFAVDKNHAYGWNTEADAKKIIGLPGEHGFRFFPSFYQHLIDTMRRIPTGRGKYVSDNLVTIEHAAFARENRAFFRFGTSTPETIRQLWKSMRRLFLQNPDLGLSPVEAAFAASKLVNAMTMCEERREAELESLPWSEYMEAHSMSDAYGAVVVNGLTQNFVAMDSRLSSTKTVINILARLFHDFTRPGRSADRVLNGPTSEAWIDHWKRYLRLEQPPGTRHEADRSGQTEVVFERKDVESLLFDPGTNRVTGVVAREGNRRAEHALGRDAQYILAVPADAAAEILENTAERTPQIYAHCPSLKSVKELKVSWMVGMSFYLKQDVELCPGHVVYLNSPWAVISISPNQFWQRKMSDRSKEVGGVLSVNLSDWDRPGRRNRHKTAREADDALEVAQETMTQIRAHLTAIRAKDAPLHDREIDRTDGGLADGNIVGFSIDTSIIFNTEFQAQMRAGDASNPFKNEASFDAAIQKSVSRSAAEQLIQNPKTTPAQALAVRNAFTGPGNFEPQFINTAGSASLRPTAVTGIENLFLAADYVKTNADLATMEAANEAARRAVNGILVATQMKRTPCQIFTYEEPPVLTAFKAIDKQLFDHGLPHPSFLVDPLLSFTAKFSETARMWARKGA